MCNGGGGGRGYQEHTGLNTRFADIFQAGIMNARRGLRKKKKAHCWNIMVFEDSPKYALKTDMEASTENIWKMRGKGLLVFPSYHL
jgi:hypothetical protein